VGPAGPTNPLLHPAGSRVLSMNSSLPVERRTSLQKPRSSEFLNRPLLAPANVAAPALAFRGGESIQFPFFRWLNKSRRPRRPKIVKYSFWQCPFCGRKTSCIEQSEAFDPPNKIGKMTNQTPPPFETRPGFCRAFDVSGGDQQMLKCPPRARGARGSAPAVEKMHSPRRMEAPAHSPAPRPAFRSSPSCPLGSPTSVAPSTILPCNKQFCLCFFRFGVHSSVVSPSLWLTHGREKTWAIRPFP